MAQWGLVYSNQSGHEWQSVLTAAGKLREEDCLWEQGKDTLDLTRHADGEVIDEITLSWSKARMGSFFVFNFLIEV